MNFPKHTFFIVFLLFSINLDVLYAQESEWKKAYDLKYFIDAEKSYDINDIIDQSNQLFKPVSSPVPGFGKGDFVAWFLLELETPAENLGSWYIEIAYPTFDTLEMYYLKNGQWEVGTMGDVFNFDQRKVSHRNFLFSMADLTPGSQTQIFFRVKTRGSVIFPVTVGHIEYFHTKHIKEEMVYGIFYGIMLVMLFYNFFLAFATRTKSYFFYILIILGNLATLSALNGHAYQYLWSDMPWWNNHIIVFGIGLWIFASNMFARAFLDLKKRNTLFNSIHLTSALLGLIILLSAFLLPYEWGMLMGNMLLPINCVLLLTTGIYFSFKGIYVARLFTIAWVIYLAGVIIYNFRSLGLVEVNFISTHVLEIGAVIEVILLSLALGAKYRKMEMERNSAMDETIKLLAENQVMMEGQNEKLERIVAERTEELILRQTEIAEQNKKLKKQSVEVKSKNTELRKAQKLIEDQNERLREYANNLEKEVASRTMEIQLSNSELAANVQKLEQYAFITAHNLRAPVARLLGLIYLMEIKPEQQEDKELADIIDKIKNSANELNEVIKDINQILEIQKERNNDNDIILLDQLVDKTKHLLRDQIDKYDVQMDVNLELKEIKTNPVFLESIFYNLISNAIKYRDPERKAVVKIDARLNKTKEYCEIKISDNGLGIDLEQHQEKLFGMYRRFHEHEDGKGLGLYLVKNQMEILGGTVKVESQVGLGTSFTLLFPLNSVTKKPV